MKGRTARVKRETKETVISASINLDGAGVSSVSTGVGFVDHMIASFAKHSMIDVKVAAKSQDDIIHHLVEDTAIVLGRAIDKALSDRSGISRFGHASVPMDEALADASVDLVRRPFYMCSLSLQRDSMEGISKEDLEHFFQSLLQNLNCCVHVGVRYGDNDHHKVEAAVKALAVAFRAACMRDIRQKGAPSTKGGM